TAGSVAINDTSRLLGAGAAYRTEFCRSCAFGSVSGLIGYRFLRLRDSLVFSSTNVPIGVNFIPGTTIAVTDQFDTTNSFHGVDLGLTGDIANGPWKLTWLAKLAIGAPSARSPSTAARWRRFPAPLLSQIWAVSTRCRRISAASTTAVSRWRRSS